MLGNLTDAVVQNWKFGTSGYHGYTMEPQMTQSRPTLTRL